MLKNEKNEIIVFSESQLLFLTVYNGSEYNIVAIFKKCG